MLYSEKQGHFFTTSELFPSGAGVWLSQEILWHLHPPEGTPPELLMNHRVVTPMERNSSSFFSLYLYCPLHSLDYSPPALDAEGIAAQLSPHQTRGVRRGGDFADGDGG